MISSRRFIKARKAKGLSQEALAIRAGCVQSLISKIESGKTDRSKYLLDLAHELDVSADYLNSDKGKESKEARVTSDEIPSINHASYGHPAIDFIIAAYQSRALSEQRLNELMGIASMYIDMGQGGVPPGKGISQPGGRVGEKEFTKRDIEVEYKNSQNG